MARHGLGGLGLTLVSWNCQRLGSTPSKVGRLVAALLQHGRPDVVLLQEVGYTAREQLEAALASAHGPGHPFKCRVYYSKAQLHGQCGTAILVPDGSPLTTPEQPSWVDSAGRVVRLDCELFQHRLSIFSVYAPAQPADRPAFLQGLAGRVVPGRITIMGGDWNLVLVPRLDEERPSQHRHVGRPDMLALMERHGLADARDALHQQQQQRQQQPGGQRQQPQPMYTRPAQPNPRESSARLDYFVVTGEAGGWVKGLQVVGGADSDHLGVWLRLEPPDLPCIGPGLQRFPTHVLYHPVLAAKLHDSLQAIQGRLQAEGLPALVALELFKSHALVEGQGLARRDRQQREHDLLCARRQAAFSRSRHERHPGHRGTRMAAAADGSRHQQATGELAGRQSAASAAANPQQHETPFFFF